MADRISTLRSIYDQRAPTYDGEGGFHPIQAADYLKWMNLQPGYNVLDLACGTGAITIPAKRLVGSMGKVYGIDISGESLSIAKGKAAKEGLDIKFIQHDITTIQNLFEIEEASFDVMTCASAFVLLENQEQIVKRWARLLKKGGRLIFDVPTNDSMIRGLVLEKVAQELEVPLIYNRTSLESAEKVRELLTGAELDPKESFLTGDYGKVEYLNSEKGEDIFGVMIEQERWFKGWYDGFKGSRLQEISRPMFCRELKKMADADGKVKEQLRFHMAVGRKT